MQLGMQNCNSTLGGHTSNSKRRNIHYNYTLRLTDQLNVFIMTSDKPQMKLHVQCINDKVCTIKRQKLPLAFTYVTESV